jgi:hypothetical protein
MPEWSKEALAQDLLNVAALQRRIAESYRAVTAQFPSVSDIHFANSNEEQAEANEREAYRMLQIGEPITILLARQAPTVNQEQIENLRKKYSSKGE